MFANTKVPALSHVCAGIWLVGIAALGVLAPARYEMLLQEDRPVEWATVWLFLMAGIVGLVRSISHRRVFDGLVALFCLFVAGEEFSWGQRLFGYYPAEFFLANNFQQEANLHNLPQAVVQPKWILMLALAGYGIVLPLVERWSVMRPHLARVGATSPPLPLLPWFAVAIVLLWWYPLTFTGEWVEAFAGGLFLASSGVSAPVSQIMLVSAVGLAFVMTGVSGQIERARDTQRNICAEEEVASLAGDITSGSAGTSDLWRMRRVHKRVWTAIQEGYLQADGLKTLADSRCDRSADLRHKYGIDPWGSPYWLEMERTRAKGEQVTVYSFGPNRRRDTPDSAAAESEVDDVRVTRTRGQGSP
jgi:hypothetical protein